MTDIRRVGTVTTAECLSPNVSAGDGMPASEELIRRLQAAPPGAGTMVGTAVLKTEHRWPNSGWRRSGNGRKTDN